MSHRALISDPFKFAAEGRTLVGKVPLAELVRLADVLVDTSGEVTYKVVGEFGSDRRHGLRLVASGLLRLNCQRCLGGIDWPLEIETVLQLVRPGEPIPEEELEIDEFDAIEAGPDMDVLALVEDEIVLAVPIAPRHESCDAPRPSDGVKKESPFAALAKLRKSDGAD
jgi:uncharacterized protein